LFYGIITNQTVMDYKSQTHHKNEKISKKPSKIHTENDGIISRAKI